MYLPRPQQQQKIRPAEDKALKIARKENPDLKQLYCKSAEFVGYIAG